MIEEKLLNDIFFSAPTPLWIKYLNQDGTLSSIIINPSCEAYFGVPAKTYDGSGGHSVQAVLNNVWGKSAERFAETDKKVMRTGKPVFALEKLLNPDTNVAEWINYVKWPIYDEKKQIIALGGMFLNTFLVNF